MSIKFLMLMVNILALATLYGYHIFGERSWLFWTMSGLTFSFVGLALLRLFTGA